MKKNLFIVLSILSTFFVFTGCDNPIDSSDSERLGKTDNVFDFIADSVWLSKKIESGLSFAEQKWVDCPAVQKNYLISSFDKNGLSQRIEMREANNLDLVETIVSGVSGSELQSTCDLTGKVSLVYQSRTDLGVYFVERNPNTNSWTSPVLLSSTLNLNSKKSKIAQDSKGNLVVTFLEQQGNVTLVKASIRKANTTAWSASVNVNSDLNLFQNNVHHYAFSMNANGVGAFISAINTGFTTNKGYQNEAETEVQRVARNFTISADGSQLNFSSSVLMGQPGLTASAAVGTDLYYDSNGQAAYALSWRPTTAQENSTQILAGKYTGAWPVNFTTANGVTKLEDLFGFATSPQIVVRDGLNSFVVLWNKKIISFEPAHNDLIGRYFNNGSFQKQNSGFVNISIVPPGKFFDMKANSQGRLGLLSSVIQISSNNQAANSFLAYLTTDDPGHSYSVSYKSTVTDADPLGAALFNNMSLSYDTEDFPLAAWSRQNNAISSIEAWVSTQ